VGRLSRHCPRLPSGLGSGARARIRPLLVAPCVSAGHPACGLPLDLGVRPFSLDLCPDPAEAPHGREARMSAVPPFDRDLLVRYDRPGPRYTSYPTVPPFTQA